MSFDVITNSSVNCSLESAKSMWEFLQPVVIAIVAGASALGGAYLGPFMQHKERKKEADRADSAIMRDKAEEIFQEIDRFLSETYASIQNARIHSKNLIDHVQSDKQNNIQRPANLGKLRALVATYYPSAILIIDDFDKKVQTTADEFVKLAETKNNNNDINLNDITAYHVLNATNRGKIDTDFANSL
jgi:hypothetical protein